MAQVHTNQCIYFVEKALRAPRGKTSFTKSSASAEEQTLTTNIIANKYEYIITPYKSDMHSLIKRQIAQVAHHSVPATTSTDRQENSTSLNSRPRQDTGHCGGQKFCLIYCHQTSINTLQRPQCVNTTFSHEKTMFS